MVSSHSFLVQDACIRWVMSSLPYFVQEIFIVSGVMLEKSGALMFFKFLDGSLNSLHGTRYMAPNVSQLNDCRSTCQKLTYRL